MRVFGLTGGIASGKTTVARRIEELGIPVVFADELARLAVSPGSVALKAIVEEFGEGVLASDGSLDRKRMGELVFSDSRARSRLNAIVHPEVARLALESFARLGSEGNELVCYEVPLLVENGLADAFRPVVLVAASESTQLERLTVRDGLTESEARDRIASQLPLDKKLAVADHVIRNEGDRASLLARTDEVVAAIRASLRSSAS